MDSGLIVRGLRRTPWPRFLLWIAPWTGLLLFGLLGIYLCLAEGLNQTNMDNRFAFGVWIFLDLAVIALGAGAFFTGFLLYILRRKELGEAADKAALEQAFVAEYRKKFYSPYTAAAMGQIDEVIAPRETRARLIRALAVLRGKVQQNPPRKHGLMPV